MNIWVTSTLEVLLTMLYEHSYVSFIVWQVFILPKDIAIENRITEP